MIFEQNVIVDDDQETMPYDESIRIPFNKFGTSLKYQTNQIICQDVYHTTNNNETNSNEELIENMVEIIPILNRMSEGS